MQNLKFIKAKHIENACKENENVEYNEVKDPQDLTFRPVVAGPNCETSHLSLLLDILLKKVQVGKDQEKAQSEKDSHSKNRGGKKTN